MIESGIFGEGSQISTNQKLENSAFFTSDCFKFVTRPRKYRTLKPPQNAGLQDYTLYEKFCIEAKEGCELSVHHNFDETSVPSDETST